MNLFITAVVILLFIAGIIGTILPMLPGVVLIYAGMILYGFVIGSLGLKFFVLQALVMVLIFVTDFAASAASTRRFGGSRQAAAGAAVGTILGLIFLGPLGIIIGPFVGATAAELFRGNEIVKALKAGFGSIVGIFGGTIFKLFAEAVMIGYFIMSVI